MDRTERFYKIDQLLSQRAVVPVSLFLEELGVSLATFKRDIEYMRSRLHAPIEWDRAAGGYQMVKTGKTGPKYELPGLWFNASEVHALLTMEHLLTNLGPGLLTPHVRPLLERLRAALVSGDHAAEEIRHRIRILPMNVRRPSTQHFSTIATGVLKRKKLRIRHNNRFRNEESIRDISPQRLAYYRDNWYVDSWCHLRNDIRSFSLDAILDAQLLDEPAKALSDKTLDHVLASGYGIFGGAQTRKAVLRFTPERARWVALEEWHPKQQGSHDPDGYYRLELPYSDDRELIGDILRHGPEIEVLEPGELRLKVAQALRRALERY